MTSCGWLPRSFHFTRDEETNQTVIEGMGELHLDIIVDRLRREFKARQCYLPLRWECDLFSTCRSSTNQSRMLTQELPGHARSCCNASQLQATHGLCSV